MRPMIHPRFVLATALLAACAGGDTDADTETDTPDSTDPSALVGVYETTYQGEAEDCGDYEELSLPIPFLEIIESTEVSGAVEVRVCRSATDCDDFTKQGYTLTNDGSGWEGGYEFSFWEAGDENGAICALNAVRVTLKERDGGTLRIATRQAQESFQSMSFQDNDDCMAELEDFAPLFNQDPLNCERWDVAPL